MKIGILKEDKKSKQVFLLPDAIQQITAKNIQVNYTFNLGYDLGIKNESYNISGANGFKSNKETIKNSDLLLKVGPFTKVELNCMKPNQIAVTMAPIVQNTNMLRTLLTKNITSLTWENLLEKNKYVFYPLIQKLYGYQSIVSAMNLLQVNNKISTGKSFSPIDPKNKLNVLILNCSFAGYEAACQSLALGANVTILDSDESYLKNLSEDKKIKALKTINECSFRTLKNDFDTLSQQIALCDLFINTSAEPIAKTKKRITTQMINNMQLGSILIDASADHGSAFEFEKDEIDLKKGEVFEKVTYSKIVDINKIYPYAFSQIISSNSYLPLIEIALAEDFSKLTVVNNVLLTRDKKVVNQKIIDQLNLNQF